MEVKKKITETKDKAVDWLRAKSLEAQYYYYAHREECLLGAQAVTVLGGGAIKLIDRCVKAKHRQQNLSYHDRKLRYDPRTGARYQLKRQLSNKEELQINRRIRNGEDLGDILQKMRVLK